MLKRRKKSLSEYSTGELVMFRFRKNKLAMFGVFLLAFVFLAVLAAPILSSYENVTKLHISDRFTSPNPLYIFGTDEFGRDLFARVLYGGRISLLCSFAIIGIAFVIGALIGGAAGFFGGKVDSFLMRIVDILMAVPSSLLAMAIITAMGNGVWKLVVALAISQVARFARIVRSSVLTLRNVEFVEAAKCYGCSSLRIILKHILPNGIGPIIVSATLMSRPDHPEYLLHGLPGSGRRLSHAGMGHHHLRKQDQHSGLSLPWPDSRHLHLPDRYGGQLHRRRPAGCL